MSNQSDNPPLKATEVKSMAEGNWETVFSTVLRGDLEEAMRRAPKHVPNPKLGGTDGFRLMKNWKTDGSAVVNTVDSDLEEIGAGKDRNVLSNGVDVIVWLRPEWTFREVLDAIVDALGGREVAEGRINDPAMQAEIEKRRKELAERQKKKDENAKQQLNRIWSGTLPLDSDEAAVARTYLENRGIYLMDLPPVMRFHPKLGVWDHEKRKVVRTLPGFVSMLQQEDELPGSLHRTFLEPDGSGKAQMPNGDSAKKLCSTPSDVTLTGGAIRLFEPEEGQDILHVTEGIESALSVRYGLGEAEPVWALYSTSLLASFNPPDWVRYLVIWADVDLEKGRNKTRAGEGAADRLMGRLQKDRGIKVSAAYAAPEVPEGMDSYDWNDVLIEYGPRAIMDLRHKMTFR
ncbi:plasmid-related protein (plasmid) [Thioalkalivibrio sp. K90mix]|uniref:DUF7146 domain-containing protein n=1 Tax=Thioalkalivibrio sp. (strain K90mix) TaxID=396595 RepID=UPI000195A94C|nr:toprim domain-containing protein [Thioalkalivibrio sp. K90mix]ADC73360.1 plasmid-related protein [Thioalkalivibrio sp. K90mix]